MRTTVLAVTAGVALAAVTGTSVAAAATAGRPHQQHQHFSVLATSANATPVVVATGLAHELGKQVTVNSKTVKFVFADGSLSVDMKRQGSVSKSYDPKTCLHTSTERGLWKVEKTDGRYHGSIGVGTYRNDTKWVQCGSKSVKVYMSDTEYDGTLTN